MRSVQGGTNQLVSIFQREKLSKSLADVHFRNSRSCTKRGQEVGGPVALGDDIRQDADFAGAFVEVLDELAEITLLVAWTFRVNSKLNGKVAPVLPQRFQVLH